MPVHVEADENQDADQAKGYRDRNTELSRGALRASRSGESPFAEEIPDADTEMERGGDNANDHKSEKPGIGEIPRDGSVGGTAVGEPAFGVEMPADVDEGDETGVALERVQPIFDPGIGGDVGIAAEPDVDAVEAVVKNGKEYEGPFGERTERNGLELAGDGVVFLGRDKDGAVRPEMFGEESAYGNNSG